MSKPYAQQAASWLVINGTSMREAADATGLNASSVWRDLRKQGLDLSRPWMRGPVLNDTHGTWNCYQERGCRCRPCTDANTLRLKETKARRVERFRRGEINPEHGSKSTYANYDCRCGPCLVAWSDHMKHRYDAQEGDIRRVRCPHCLRMMATRSDGTIRAHRDTNKEPCEGGGTPVEGLAA